MKLPIEFFSSMIVVLTPGFLCYYRFYFVVVVELLVLFMYCFPNFFCVCSYGSLNFFQRIILNSFSGNSCICTSLESVIRSLLVTLVVVYLSDVSCCFIPCMVSAHLSDLFLQALKVCFGRLLHQSAQFDFPDMSSG